jgi:hypothetical protein
MTDEALLALVDVRQAALSLARDRMPARPVEDVLRALSDAVFESMAGAMEAADPVGPQWAAQVFGLERLRRAGRIRSWRMLSVGGGKVRVAVESASPAVCSFGTT